MSGERFLGGGSDDRGRGDEDSTRRHGSREVTVARVNGSSGKREGGKESATERNKRRRGGRKLTGDDLKTRRDRESQRLDFRMNREESE